MARRLSLTMALACAIAACSGPRDAASVLRDAQQAMGNVNSIQYSGTGMNACDDRGCRRDHRDEDGPDLDKTGDIAGIERSALTGKR